MDSNKPLKEKLNIKHIYKEFNEGISYLKEKYKEMSYIINSNINQIRQDMSKGRKELTDEINKLKTEFCLLKERLDLVENNLKTRLDEAEKEIGILLSNKVKQESLEFRESNGGKIDSVQHQDLLSRFRELKQLAIALSNEIKNTDNTLKNRGVMRAKISKILTNNLSFENWINELSLNDAINDTKLSEFKLFYDKTHVLINDMNAVKPLASFYNPHLGESYDKEFHILISEKCDEMKPISLIVFPGLFRGNVLNEKAVVFTD